MSADGDLIRSALDLGLQAWRTTPVRDRFHDALAALARLEAAEAQRDALAEVVLHVLRHGDVGKQSERRLRAALSLPTDPPEDETEFVHAMETP